MIRNVEGHLTLSFPKCLKLLNYVKSLKCEKMVRKRFLNIVCCLYAIAWDHVEFKGDIILCLKGAVLASVSLSPDPENLVWLVNSHMSDQALPTTTD